MYLRRYLTEAPMYANDCLENKSTRALRNVLISVDKFAWFTSLRYFRIHGSTQSSAHIRFTNEMRLLELISDDSLQTDRLRRRGNIEHRVHSLERADEP